MAQTYVDKQNLEALVLKAVTQTIRERSGDGALRVAELLQQFHTHHKVREHATRRFASPLIATLCATGRPRESGIIV